ncbi:hypothetical protein WR25_08434 [Diploscapter pachys]|uniref:PHLPP-like RA domain-containing protein n=1 Tax=Diploscapter pachys TaxID=2018661 RepID=A0A2A2K9D3_9BILA|nr:hypothetical protein WR25_08434 [Diploscapter pachys]
MQPPENSKTPGFIKRGGPLVYAAPAYSTYSSLSSATPSTSCSIRFYSPDARKSSVVRLNEGTNVGEICRRHKVDCVYLQIGNLHLRQLSESEQPLKIQKQILLRVGHSKQEALEVDTDQKFRHLFAFFLGRPCLQINSSIKSEILITECQVRRGKVVHRWGRNKCILYNGTIRIHKDSGEDEVIHLSKMRAELHNSRRGKCLRLTDTASIYLFLFDDDETFRLWLSRSQQNEHSATCDLSDQRLILLPEALLNSDDISHLNLRRNSLMSRPQNFPTAPIGTVDDISRLMSLTSLDLSFNQLKSFPFSLVHLPFLRSLNLSSNCIADLPPDIGSILTSLLLSNNWLSTLPPEIAECRELTQLDLSFNRFDQIPDILSSFSNILQWQLAGNCIESVGCHPSALQVINSLNLRRNYLSSSFRLPNVTYSHLTSIDIRDNAHISTVFLTNIPSLQVLHCERLQLTSLHVNGQSLVELHADHNLLDTLVIMPVPLHLTMLSLSHNHFDSLPEWIADLPQLVQLQVNNNKLAALPERLFLSSSLRYLLAYNNEIQTLPQEIGESSLETLILYNNRITSLPPDFFKRCIRLRHVNLSSNRLAALPQPHPNSDNNRIQIFRCANNQLTECCLPVIVNMKRLRILDLSNNDMSYFDDSALPSLSLLEEISLCDNRLSRLSPSLPLLPALQILRIHSNCITDMPEIANSLTLQLVDLSGNLVSLRNPISPGPALRHLDISANPDIELSGW